MAENIKIHGLEKLQQFLREFPEKLGNRVVLGGLRAAAIPMRKEAQSRVPILTKPSKTRKPGTVRKNIIVRRSKQGKFAIFIGVQPYSRAAIREFKKSQKAAGVRVGRDDVKAFKKTLGKTISPDDPFYWWFLEFGTVNMPGTSFMRAAFEMKKYESLKRFEEYTQARVVKEAEKFAREIGVGR